MKRREVLCLLVSLLAAAGPVSASGRYRDIFIGNKAAGLGGAFIAVADDNNAVWYNPAGMVLVKGSCVGTSPSFEAHANGREKSFLGEDEGEWSLLFVPTALASVSDLAGGKLGLGIFMPVKDNFTQTTHAGPVTAGSDTWSGFLDRTENEEIFYAGAAYAYPLTERFSLGGAFYYVSAVYTHNLYKLIYDPTSPAPARVDYEETEIKESEKLTGFCGMMGAMFRPLDNLRFGLTLWSRARLSGSGLYREIDTTVDALGVVTQPRTIVFNTDNDEMIIPARLGLGLCWRISPSWMMTVDMVRCFSASYRRYDSRRVDVVPVTNTSVGFEWRITPRVPFRFGFFSNNAYTPLVDESDQLQKAHVDVGGVTLGAGYEGERNVFFGGLKIAAGTGKDKVRNQVTDTYEVVNAASYTLGLFLGINYNF